MMKINFKQPKYIFPLVVFVPLCALVYFVMQTFGGGGDTRQTVATDRINMELPEANAEEAGDKMTEMSRRFGDEDAFTAVGAIGEEEKDKEELEHGYSEEELNRLDAAEAERIRQQQEMEELERSLAESRKHINSYAYGSSSSGNVSQDDFARDLEEIQRRSYQRQKAIESGLGFGNPDQPRSRGLGDVYKRQGGFHRQGTHGGKRTQPAEPCRQIIRCRCRKVPYGIGTR